MTAAILLAAGESTRMGRTKALLPWAGTTLVRYQVGELRAAGVDDVVVVLGHAADEVRPAVPLGARVVVNQAYREGRASSLRTGASALANDAGPIVVLGVDQPRPREVHERLLAAHRASNRAITLPVSDGRRGHPIVLANALLPELRAATEEAQGLRGVIAAHERELNEVHYMLFAHESAIGSPDMNAIAVLLDINTPEEYEAALAQFGRA